MQTFLPYSSFSKSANHLDPKRLGKQRVEAYQILNIISGKSTSNAWQNHPAVKMWRGYEDSLTHYMNCMIEEWIKRGYHNTMKVLEIKVSHKDIVDPPFIGTEDFHSSHRAALLFKDFEFYSQFGWKEKPGINYIWPV